MLFDRKRQNSSGGISHPSDPEPNDLTEGESRHWESWRRSAQKVRRAWNEYSAAGLADRGERFRRYVEALAEEEDAAARVAIHARRC